MNDIWKYSVASNDWEYVDGDLTRNMKSSYAGTLYPGGVNGHVVAYRENARSFVVFGGLGYDASNLGIVCLFWLIVGLLNTMWEYDIVEGNWTVLSGSTAVDPYATMIAGLTTPGGLYNAAFAMTKDGNSLYLFGGYGFSTSEQGMIVFGF